MTSIEIHDDDLGEVELPTKKAVCPRCRGTGTHVNPAIDGNGLTSEDFDDDPDFREAYFAGRYDVVCYDCRGNNVIDVLDEDRCTPEQLAAYDRHCKAMWEIEACEAAERRAGA